MKTIIKVALFLALLAAFAYVSNSDRKDEERQAEANEFAKACLQSNYTLPGCDQ